MNDEQAQAVLSVTARTTWGRRHLLSLGVVGVTALAGGGMAWRSRDTGLGHGERPVAVGDLPLWALKFDAPVGDAVVMSSFRGKPLLLNFWATWCPPCVEELPLLNRFYQENRAKSWQVVGVAIDQPSAVLKFLGKLPLSFPVAMGGLEGTEVSRMLGNKTGSLPFTVVLDATGRVVHRKMGTWMAKELEALLAAYSPH